MGVEIGLVELIREQCVWADFFYKMFNPVMSGIRCKKNEGEWCTHLREFLLIQITLFRILSLALTTYDHVLLPRPVLLTLNDTF